MRLFLAPATLTLADADAEGGAEAAVDVWDVPFTRLLMFLSGSSLEVSESASDAFPSCAEVDGAGVDVDQAGAERR